jgi:hypothetical protein
MARLMSASRLIEVPSGLCSSLTIYSGSVVNLLTIINSDESTGLETPLQGKNMYL